MKFLLLQPTVLRLANSRIKMPEYKVSVQVVGICHRHKNGGIWKKKSLKIQINTPHSIIPTYRKE